MAIIIPSKNIYDKQNPKARDNVIERIEVGAIEVVPNNEYETPVYNSNISFDLSSLPIIENTNKEKYESTYNDMFETLEYDGGYVYFDNKVKYLSSTIIIPKLYNNSLISKLYYGKDNENKDEVKYSLILNKTKKTVNANVKLEYKTAQLISKSYGQLVDEGNKTQDDLKLPITIKNTEGGVIVSVEGLQNETNMTVDFAEYENEYHLSYKVLVYMYAEWYTGGYYNVMGNPGYPTQTITAKGFVEEYTPLKLEITVYGNTIGIDLTDKTVYINGETAKKVHSIDGNELMQYKDGKTIEKPLLLKNYVLTNSDITNAYYKYSKILTLTKTYSTDIFVEYELDGAVGTRSISAGDNGLYFYYNTSLSIKRVYYNEISAPYKSFADFTNTLNEYKNGKETATIRCSISDYYIYDNKKPNNQGNKAISIDYSTIKKMCFKIGDVVIPMVYGADGKDAPLSIKENGSPKEFVVRGQKIFYDGAVWQELYLQET